jgi:hypothetical protein
MVSVGAGLLMAMASAGCSDGPTGGSDRPDVVPASGTITYNGSAVEGATVVLVPEASSGGYAASGLTDADGRFELSTFAPDAGAVPGKYKVSVTKIEAPASAAGPEGGHDESETPPPKDLLPAKYKDAAKSELTAEIPADGTDELTFDLKD